MEEKLKKIVEESRKSVELMREQRLKSRDTGRAIELIVDHIESKKKLSLTNEQIDALIITLEIINKRQY